MKNVVTMASYPDRKQAMIHQIERMAPQCDVMCLWLDQYNEIPSELNEMK